MAEFVKTTQHNMDQPAVEFDGAKILVVVAGREYTGEMVVSRNKAKRLFGVRIDSLARIDDRGPYDKTYLMHGRDLTKKEIESIDMNPAGDPPFLLRL